MNLTKEELDEAISFLTDGFRQDASVIKTALTILTRYRDGELVEKTTLHELKQVECKGDDDYQSCYNNGWNDLIQHLTTPPTNQTEP